MNPEIIPVSKASFVLAYCEANPWDNCRAAIQWWDLLHRHDVIEGEIDEDP